MNLLHHILDELGKSYYTELILWLAELTAVTTGFIYARKQQAGRLFTGYLLFNFIVLTIDLFHAATADAEHVLADRFTIRLNVILSVVDVFIYSSFYILLLRSRAITRIIRAGAGVFIAGSTILVGCYYRRIDAPANDTVTKLFFIAGFLLLLLCCMAYYYEQMVFPGRQSLASRPSFWITTGMFFYTCVSLPYFLVVNYLHANNYTFINLLSALFFVLPFAVNSFFITKAFLCKKILLT